MGKLLCPFVVRISNFRFTVIYVPSFINIGSAIQKLLDGIHIETQTARLSHKPTFVFVFFKIRKVGSK
jgi:hypothetical protein